jgi:hypothetical protein
MKNIRFSAEGGQNPPASRSEHRESSPELDRLTYRFADLVEAFGVSRRTLERERSAGRFPAPDLRIGKLPLWKVATIRRWIDEGGAR